jgi:hypothetical protein
MGAFSFEIYTHTASDFTSFIGYIVAGMLRAHDVGAKAVLEMPVNCTAWKNAEVQFLVNGTDNTKVELDSCMVGHVRNTDKVAVKSRFRIVTWNFPLRFVPGLALNCDRKRAHGKEIELATTWDDTVADTILRCTVPKGSVNVNPACPAGTNVNRVAVEFCCSEKSKFCTPSKASRGCELIRVTQNEGPTKKKKLKWLVEHVREKTENGRIPCYVHASLPCAGGSSWTWVNRAMRVG